MYEDLITFLQRHNDSVPLYRISHALLCFCHSTGYKYTLGQPPNVPINETQERGPCVQESYLEVDGKKITFNHTIIETVNLLKE